MFSILKNEKRVWPKRIIKGRKERKIKKKDIKYEPHKKEAKINSESVAHSNATTPSLLYF